MKYEFTQSQLDFIFKEFGLTETQLESADEAVLDKLCDDIFDIEADEVIECGDKKLSDRGRMAVEIVDLMSMGG
jgi:hypothetical protein